METWEEKARARAYDDPADAEVRVAAYDFTLRYFGGCRLRAAAFFDEFAKAVRDSD